MTHYGTLGKSRRPQNASAADIRGSEIYGRKDDKLGKIDDVIFDHGSGVIRYVVVDTGGWLSSKRFIVPPEQLSPSAKHKDAFSSDLDKQQIENFPPYDESALKSQDRWQGYEERYQAAWMSDPVQHRKGSDHNITPTAREMPPEPGSLGSQISPQTNARLSERVIPAGANEVTIKSSAVGLGSRWLTFESWLRQSHRDVTEGCPSCSVGPVSDRAVENVSDERKAV